MNQPVENVQETPDNEPGALLVIDSSVNEENPVRVHEIVIGDEIIPVTFKLGEPTILPFKHGIKFMKDGFTVKAASGNDLNLPAVASDNVVAQLAPDETVAKYGELTFTALKLRASQKKDGEIYLDADEDDRADIIAFLIGNTPQPADESLIEEDEGDESQTIDVSEEKITPNPDAFAKKMDAIVRHFGDGRENVTSREVDEINGAKVYDIVHVDPDAGENVLVKGTLADLHQATIEGVNAGRFNSDQDANAPVETEEEASSPDGENGQVDESPSNPDAESIDEAPTSEGNDASAEDVEGTPQSADQESGGTQPEDTVSEEAVEAPAEGEADAEEQTFTIDEVEGATDEAMRLAVENGVDINDVVGTGEDGNVLVGDVEAYIEASKPEAPAE